MTPEPVEVATEPSSAAAMLAALEQIAGTSGKRADIVRDVHAMLEAQDLEAKGDVKDAVGAWREALATADGRFGKRAFEGWLKAYTRALGKVLDRTVLARLILAETREGTSSHYMAANGLTTDTALSPVLAKLVPEWLTPLPPPPAATELTPPPHGMPADDPLLVNTAARTCKSHASDADAWKNWRASLPPNVRSYWDALLLQCSGSHGKETLATLKNLYPRLSGHKATQALAIEAAGRLVSLQRAVGQRTDAATTYRDLVALWSKPGATPAAFGLDPLAFALRRINETLWAARYQDLIGDYEDGKAYAQTALKEISNAFTTRDPIPPTMREQLADLRAEAYHDLAYRVAVERQEYESALSLDLLGLASPDLSRDWQERLTWFAGFYDYLAGHFDSARKRWEGLLATTQTDSLKATLDFWLARAYTKLGRGAEGRFYLTSLIKDYPLSYYATVATPQLAEAPSWSDVFGSPQDLRHRLTHVHYDLTRVRQMPALGRLLRRAEILNRAHLGAWASMAVDDLDSAMSGMPVADNVDAFVYLSRLHFIAGSYLKAIALTTRIVHAVPDFWHQWPAQILVYFPEPYHADYDRNATETSLDVAVLLGISRQESGFKATLRSSANAIGVMQLIRPTARRYAEELGMPATRLEQTLRNPSANIRIGSRYLKTLSLTYKGYAPAIYGGYNAGEFAMNNWLKRRNHSDPLVFIELIPFGETKGYVKNVWRNVEVYRYLHNETADHPARDIPGKPEATVRRS